MRTLQRAVRAAFLDRKTHSELFFDDNATADGVMVVAGVAAVVYLWRVIVDAAIGFSIEALLQIIIYALIGWLLLAATTWFAASRLFRGSGSVPTMLRLHGFTHLPLILNAAGSTLLAGVAIVWWLVSLVVATKEAAGTTTRDSALSVLIGFALVALVRLLFAIPFYALQSLF